ncbi:MAG: hypothetical protein PHH13_04945 [Candidatus Peribacteraceae bacterium]|nr:hypothetical protein [Candidatus Peribacteraceae bacterium]
MDIIHVSRGRFLGTTFWAVLLCCVIVAVAATLGRASYNIKAAVTDKPDLAVYMLLPDEHVTSTTLLRSLENERHYVAETKDGPKLVILRKGEKEWYVSEVENLR